MFHTTLTFLVVFLLLNQQFAAARDFNMPQYRRESAQMQYREAQQKAADTDWDRLEATVNDDMKELGIHPDQHHHSREKRKWGQAARLAIAGLGGASFGVSIGFTIYGAIEKCKAFRPDTCLHANCTFLDSCPNVCKSPNTNRDFVGDEKVKLRKRLGVMDNMQLVAFNLATKAISASLDNKKILIEINRINSKVHSFMYKMLEFDLLVAEKFRNNSVRIKTLIRDHRLSLEDILASPEIEGIFDKWTWEGTGIFVISLALPLGVQFFNAIRERIAINKIAKDLKVDFSNRFAAQKNVGGGKLHNKFAANLDLSTKNLDKQLRKAAKAQYYSEKANAKLTKMDKFTQNVVGPLVNLVVIGLSVWSIYQYISNCQKITDDMQNTALLMANKMNDVEGLMKTGVEPLYNDVKTQAWQPVKDLLTNGTIIDWLVGIRNLTQGANQVNQTTITKINGFIDNIDNASVSQTIKLQGDLYDALEHIEFEFDCLENKQHALVQVLKECREGDSNLDALYAEATSKYKLNVKACIDKKMVAYTSLAQFKEIIEAFSAHQGWYSDCVLNDNDLRDRVCDQKLKGYTTLDDIIKHTNRTILTPVLAKNFLTRCPPPKITPAGINNTCKLHCLYDTPQEIAKTVILLVSQVNLIIAQHCGVCVIRQDQEMQICNLHFCKGESASTIEPKVRVPLTSVQHYIANVCVQKCIITNAMKIDVCNRYKCQGYSVTQIAKKLAIPVSTVNEEKPNCNTLVPKCVVTDEEKEKVVDLYCYGFPPFLIKKYVHLSTTIINNIIASTVCPTTIAP